MGLTRADLVALKPILKRVTSVLSLGYPDINISREELCEMFHVELRQENPVMNGLPDTQEFFSVLGKRFLCCDVKVLRGCEFLADLNEKQYLPKADLVIDPGTLEHCFNIGQAALNAAWAVNPGGFIFHTNPVSMVNHGFYCISPTWYYDWYHGNGWKIVQKVTDGEVSELVHPVKRIHCKPELSNLVIAEKPEKQTEMKWPVQSKYKRMLESAV